MNNRLSFFLSSAAAALDNSLPQSIVDKLRVWWDFDSERISFGDAGRLSFFLDKLEDPTMTASIDATDVNNGMIWDPDTFRKPVVKSSWMYPFNFYEVSDAMEFVSDGSAWFISFVVAVNNEIGFSWSVFATMNTEAPVAGVDVPINGNIDGPSSGAYMTNPSSDPGPQVFDNVPVPGLAMITVAYDSSSGLRMYKNGVKIEGGDTLTPDVTPADVLPRLFRNTNSTPATTEDGAIIGELMIGDEVISDAEATQIYNYYKGGWGNFPVEFTRSPCVISRAGVNNATVVSSRDIDLTNAATNHPGALIILTVGVAFPFTGSTYTDPLPSLDLPGLTLIESNVASNVNERISLYTYFKVLEEGDEVFVATPSSPASISYSYLVVRGVDEENPIYTEADRIGKYNSAAVTTNSISIPVTELVPGAFAVAISMFRQTGVRSSTSPYFKLLNTSTSNFITMFGYPVYNFGGDEVPVVITKTGTQDVAKGLLIQLRPAS